MAHATAVRTNLVLHGGFRLHEAADFPADAKDGATCLLDGVLYVRAQVGGVSAWLPLNGPQAHHVHTQGAPARVWELNHGFRGSVSVLAYDKAGNNIPAAVASSEGMASVDVGGKRTGYAVVFGLAFASVAQGEKADSAVQPDYLAETMAPIATAKVEIMEREVVTAGRISDLENSPHTQRWPSWGELDSKPLTYPPAPHSHNGHHALETDLKNALGQLADALNQGAADVRAVTIQ